MKQALEYLKKAIEILESEESDCECESCDCETVEENRVQLCTLAAGMKFKTDIGNFIVLDHLEEGTLVITEGLFAEDVKFGDSTNFKESELRELFATDIYEKFVGEFGANNMIVHEADLMTLDGQNLYGKYECRVRPLTFDEARKYNALLVNKDLPDWYWTLTPWSSKERGWEYSVAVVSPSGYVSNRSYDGNCGVRPICILKSNIFVSKKGE